MPVSTPSAAPGRKMSSILFADVYGYSRMMDLDEEGTYRRVTRAITLIRDLIGDYGGRVVEVAGDGVLATFDSVTQALRFAVEIQREFRNEAVWHDIAEGDEPLAFRVGINLGEVIVEGDSVRGHSVNVAARLQALAPPGGICVSGIVQRTVRDAALGVRMRALGPLPLKNIAEPVEVFAIDLDGGPEPRAAPSPPPEPLPALSPPDPPLESPDQASVAVLPLVNLSGDPRDDHLCKGITADVITGLCRFRELLVIARHSAFLFAGRDLSDEQIGRRLGARYLVTGALQRAGGRLRVRVRLSEAATEQVFWSEHYDGDLGDVFAFEDDLTETVAARLAIQISTAERRRALAQQPPDLRAYGLILRGQDLSLQFRRESNAHARRLFERAAEIDPGYGRSYAAMSRTFNLDWRYAWAASPGTALERAVDLALAAIRHDSLDARGYGELGFAHLYRKEHAASLAAYERAIELNPNDADLLAEMGDALSYAGQDERAIGLLRRAMRLNPFHPDWYLWYLGEAHFHLGDYEEAIRTLRRMRNQAEAHRLLASSYAHLGRMAEARQEAEQVMKVHPNFSIAHWRTVPPYKNPDQLEVFIDGLRKAGLK